MKNQNKKRAGVIYGLGAYLSWGILPFYFKAVAGVPPMEVLAHRVLWSLAFLLLLILFRGQWRVFTGLFQNPRTQATLAVSMILIATNWGVFIWAITHQRLVEASLGYFITPLVSVLLGFFVLRERLRPRQVGAVVLAAAGIVWMTARYGHPPVISMLLAVSFGFYGLLRKQVPVSGIHGLAAETLMLSPLALGWMIWRRGQGELVFLEADLALDGLLLAAGVVTALPLIWFAEGARRLRLVTMGFLQYLAPTCQLLVAVLVFGEPFTRDHAVGFGLIWAALAVYSWDTLGSMRREQSNPAGPWKT